MFLNTNITYASNTTYLNQFAGSLLVAVNDDATIPDGVVHVTMHHSTPALGNATHVCLMEAHDGDGLYLFVRLLSGAPSEWLSHTMMSGS